jgi:filamentous hemagglutinin family protein
MANETTTHFSARKRLIVVAVSACFASAPAWSNPTAPQVVNGAASFNQAGKLLTVTNSNGAIINWNTFSIGANETTRFNQTSAASSVLNRVLANDPSVLLGTLSSNGRVWLVNPAGIMVGQGARIDVAGFIASTLNVRNEDFLAGRLNFQATPNAGKIENYGQITTPSGGSVYLVAPAVENYGVINAPNGEVILAAGQTVQLIDTGTPGVRVDITGAEGNVTNLGDIVSEAGRIGMAGVLVKNSGTLNASSLVKEGGRVFLKASQDAYVDGAGRIVATGTKGGSIEVLGNNVTMAEQAVIDASGGQQGGGNILLKADMSSGTTTVAGSLLAKGGAQGGDGGFIETSGAHVKIADSARVSTSAPNGQAGTWLIDPADYTIAASGGDITGSALGSNLNGSNVTILSSQGTVNPSGNGDIFVNDAVGWTSTNTLSLSAFRNINVNNTISNVAGGSLVLRSDNTGTGTGTVAFTIGGGVTIAGGGRADLYYNPVSYTDGPTKSDTVTNPYTLKIFGSPNNYTAWMLVNNVGAYGGAGGLQGMTTNLLGNYALGTNIDASATNSITWDGGAGFVPVGNASYGSNFLGKFDGLNHTITALTINRPTTDYGGLIGYAGSGSVVRNVGLVGGSVTGQNDVGGLVGFNSSGTITNSYSTGNVTSGSPLFGVSAVGGLVGNNSSGTITNSYSTGNVTAGNTSYGGSNVGGLVGFNNLGDITNSYSTGNVTGYGGNFVGGLVGNNSFFTATPNTILNSYSTGSVTGNSCVGGLVGLNSYGGITNSYSTGSVTGLSSYGGLVGSSSSTTITSSYWDTQTSGQATSAGGTGETTALMKLLATFSGWSIADTGGSSAIWRIYDDSPSASTYPLLKSFLTPLTVTATSGSRAYDGTTAGIGVSSPVTTDLSKVLGTPTYTGAIKNVGTYTITPGGLYSIQQGYDISYASGALTINQAALSVTATAVTKTYDGTLTATGTGTVGTIAGAGDMVLSAGSQAFLDKNFGIGNKTVRASGVTIQDALAADMSGNYTITYTDNTASTINKAALGINAVTDTKTYDGGTTSAGVVSFTNLMSGDSVTGAVQAFGSKNVLGTNLSTLAVTPASYTVNDTNAGGNYTVTLNTATGTINKAVLGVTATAVTKTYDGTLTATGTGTVGTIAVAGDVVLSAGSQAFLDKNFGIGNKTVRASGVTIKDALAADMSGNYTITYTDNATSTINPHAVSLSGSRVYDGTANVAAGVLSFGTLVGAETLALSGSGTMVDKNVGAKTVNLGSLALGDGSNGGLASNYTFIGGTRTANITQLASVAWTGGVTGNWSQASNWAGSALPDGSNVLAVTIPSGSTVIYDPGTTTANTTLNTLISSGALTLAGGAGSILTVNSQLTTPQFTMTSGSLTGTGNLTVSNNYSQSGGTIALTGTATAGITQVAGNLLVGSLAAPSVMLAAQAGAISQSAPIVASNLITQSVTGTTLTDTGNKIATSFTATNSGSGNVALTNTGVLSIGSISNTNGNITIDNTGAVTTVGAVSAPAGAVSIVAHSPLSIGTGGVSSGGNITLTAGGTAASTDNLTLNGVVQTTGSASSITLLANDNLVQNANVTTNGGAVNATAQLGNISMALGATTSTGGGSIGYTPSLGNVTLSSLNAGSGSIALSAGGNITPVTGFSGANLIGGTATIAAGGNANLSTQVKLLDTTGIKGTFSIFDQLTGSVLTNGPAAETSTTTTEPLSTTTVPVVNQVLSTVVTTTQQQPIQTTTQTQPPPVTTAFGGSSSTLLSNSTQTTGGTADTFGGSSSGTTSSGTTSSGTTSSGTSSSGQSDKPADDKSASAKKDDKKDDDKKKGEGTSAKKDEGKPAAKKLATCS